MALRDDAIATRPPRTAIDSFSVAGRVAVRNAERSFSASFDWQHGKDSDELLLTGALGQGLARLSRTSSGARLQTADGKTFVAADLDALSAGVFGMTLPMGALPDWVLGRQASAADQVERDDLGRATRLGDGAWRVLYETYESQSADALPSALELGRDQVLVRIRIERWDVAR